ncbi:alpha/beta fold hydrolase [Streptomyces echinatus]|uniref:Pimeloyl-ACP methyl ester carboxylesterase n=1 Tax=Streptomyces echinatus TaxID=67293 RepID=A0A7W9UPX3_9ACTN|nr:alpha/beta fold hydrolase [Streptomyces echinatus]MBB5926326.1 pimeloyl-ACP methyl ester carboxylesterase [Streptomyces echinatus]
MRPGTRAADAILRLLSRDRAGLAVALLPAAAGAWCVTRGRGRRILGGVLWAVALALGLGSFRHLVHVGRTRVRYPPPGRMVDVGGYRMHVLAEGDAGPRPTVVWMPGGHAGGYAMHRLHALAREQMRSVLVDRPGSGWSDPGPFPRTTAVEAEELLTALERAGEKGPYVFVGHSFGGLLMANAARRRPDLVAGLVLLDPTPPDAVAFGPALPALRRAPRNQTALALRHLFGLHPLVSKKETPSDDPAQVLAMVELRTKANCAAASILRELSPDGITRDGWQTAVHDGDLDSLPLLLVAPRDLAGGGEIFDGVDDPEERARVRHFFLTVRERFLAASSRGRRVYTPEGTGHDFPDRVPGFVVQVVGSLLDQCGPGEPKPF